MVKCMVHNGFCELHTCDTNDNGKCPVGEEFAPQLPAPQLGANDPLMAYLDEAQADYEAEMAKVKRPFPGMCEVCGTQAAVPGMFECEECLLRMAKDYE